MAKAASVLAAAAKSKATAPTKRVQPSQRKGNRRGVYKIENGYYLNWQACGDVHRQAFSAKRYGSMTRALAKASQLYDYLEQNREWIEEIIRYVKAGESVQQGAGAITLADATITQLVENALDEEPSRRVVSS